MEEIKLGDLVGIKGANEIGKVVEVGSDILKVKFDYCNLELFIPRKNCYVVSSISKLVDKTWGVNIDVNGLGDHVEDFQKPELKDQDSSILRETEGHTPDPLFSGHIHFIPFAFHLVPVEGLAKVAAVMRKGERKGRSGWEKVPVEEHINHAIAHLLGYLAGRKGHSHLANAGCRILMALSLDKTESWPRVDPGE